MGNLSQYIAASRVDDVNNPVTSHLSFWTGSETEFEALRLEDATSMAGVLTNVTTATFVRPTASVVDLTTIFNVNETVYVDDDVQRVAAVIAAVTATTVEITFDPPYSTSATTFLIDLLDPSTLYFVTEV